MNKLDKLFKDKLSGREEKPSPAAWNKLQGQLNAKKKNKLMLYYKIAAAVVLILLSALAITRFDASEGLGNTEIADIHQEINQPTEGKTQDYHSSTRVPDHKVKENEQTVQEGENFLSPGTEVARNKEKIKNPSNAGSSNARGNKSLKAEQESIEVPELDIAPEIILADADPDNSSNINPEKEKLPGITITYKKGKKADENFSPTEGVAFKAENDHSPVKRFLKLAREIREADIDLAELRDTKEELFALEITRQKNQ